VAAKRGLGKGLSALLPSEIFPTEPDQEERSPEEESSLETTTEELLSPGNDGNSGAREKPAEAKKQAGENLISLDKLKSNPNQPRKTFDAAALEELANSIRQQGVIQPVIAEETGDGTYTIIAGERRSRAARLAGLTEIPAIIRKYSEQKRMEVSLIENIQRSDLNPIEEAQAYKQLMDMEGLSQDEAATRVGKNRVTVANSIRLLKLPAEMQESLQKGELTAGHARALLSLQDTRARGTLFNEIIKKGISVREAEKRAAALGEHIKIAKKRVKGRAPELTAMEERLITSMGTKVVLKGDLNKGSIMIDYYSMEDLERLYELITN